MGQQATVLRVGDRQEEVFGLPDAVDQGPSGHGEGGGCFARQQLVGDGHRGGCVGHATAVARHWSDAHIADFL